MVSGRPCKVCGKSFHHCPSCDHYGEWWYNWGCCCESCAELLPKVNEDQRTCAEFGASLSEKQWEQFEAIVEMLKCDYEDTYEPLYWARSDAPEKTYLCPVCCKYYKESGTEAHANGGRACPQCHREL